MVTKADLAHENLVLNAALTANNETIGRALFARSAGTSFGGARDVAEVLGYNKNPTIEHYLARYFSQDIARRLIDGLPDAIWPSGLIIQEDGDRKRSKTEFELAFESMAKRLRLFHYYNRLDKLVGLGHYAVLYIGVSGDATPNEPLTSLNSTDDVMYLMPFNEQSASIQKYDNDITSPRYGMPDMYTLQTGGYGNSNSSAMGGKSVEVHHSRIIHCAEGTLENNVFGIPRLRPVLNRLDDLEKVVGGSAEIFWLNGRGGINFNADKDSHIVDTEQTKMDIDDYVNQLKRVLLTKGMDARTLELGIHDPDKHVSVILDLISGATGYPKRILIGSERGELASSQDENNWWSRVKERRDNFCEPMMLRPFVDKLIAFGALPQVDEYEVVWPDLVSMSELDKAKTAVDRAGAIAAYVNSNGGDLIVPPEQFVTDVLNLEWREADVQAMLELERDDMDDDEKNFDNNG